MKEKQLDFAHLFEENPPHPRETPAPPDFPAPHPPAHRTHPPGVFRAWKKFRRLIRPANPKSARR